MKGWQWTVESRDGNLKHTVTLDEKGMYNCNCVTFPYFNTCHGVREVREGRGMHKRIVKL